MLHWGAEEARKQGLSQLPDNVDLHETIKKIIWEPEYYPYRKV